MSFGKFNLASPGAFRLALAFAVFLHHTTSVNLGLTAVLVFFVLSGYWVATMWRDTYSNTSLSYLTYLGSRLWRVAPVFALCSAISWVLLYARGGAPEMIGGVGRQLFSNMLILGYNSLPYQANVPGWSLDMEVQFYLVAPALIFFLSRNVLALGVCALVTAFSSKLGGATTVAPFLLFFGIGVAAASHGWRPTKGMAYASLSLTSMTIFLCALLLIKDISLGEPHSAPLLAFSSPTAMLIAVLLTPWALYTTTQKSGPRDRMLGDLSYIFYLLHWSVIGLIGTGEGSYAHRILLCSEALVVIFAASYLIWRVFDRPLNKMRAAWVAGRRVDGDEEMVHGLPQAASLAS
jgi:peptidoglycan/LPS O-acetylase OafA/YrhL